MYAFVKDHFIKLSDAKVNINNRSFKFGDGFFDNIIIYKSKIINWDHHSSQFKNNMQLTRMSIDIDFIKSICCQLIDLNKLNNGLMRVSISRGDGGAGFLPDKTTLPYLVIQTSIIDNYNFSSVNLYLSQYKKIDTGLSRIKPENGLISSLLRLEAQDHDCFESLCLDNNNNVAECSSSNIFWISNNIFYTPSENLPIYLGSARNIVINYLKQNNIKIIEGEFDLKDLYSADEVFITNTRWIIKPISKMLPMNKIFDNCYYSQKIANSILNSFE
jgi:branched-subunit amino acid aminotransferase/4-amino-4-deoxychorismate lyase